MINNSRKISLLICIIIVTFPHIINSASYIPEVIQKNIKFVAQIKNFTPTLDLKSPVKIETDTRDNIYILDKGHQMIFIYNRDFIPIDKINSSKGLISPICFCIHDDGFIYVSMKSGTEQKGGMIGIFNSLGRLEKKIFYKDFPQSENFLASDIAIDEKGNLYLAAGAGFPLIILDKEGTFLSSISPREQQMGKIVSADVTAVKLTDSEIFLLSEGMGRVYVYSKDGKFIRMFARKGGSTGKLSRARGLSIDKKTNLVYIMDYLRHTLSIYNIEGKFITEYGGFGYKPKWFNYPNGICLNENGRLFVADTFNKRVQVFDTRTIF